MDIIKLGSLYSLKIYLTKYSATKIALIKSIGIICRIFIRQLTTTIIFVNPLLSGKSTIKLIKRSRHLYIGISNSQSTPYFLYKKSFYGYMFCILKYTSVYNCIL